MTQQSHFWIYTQNKISTSERKKNSQEAKEFPLWLSRLGTQHSVARKQVQSLAPLSGLRIWH